MSVNGCSGALLQGRPNDPAQISRLGVGEPPRLLQKLSRGHLKARIVLGFTVLHEQTGGALWLVVSHGVALAGQRHDDVVVDDPDAKRDVMHGGRPQFGQACTMATLRRPVQLHNK
jgi:hypothetical protein